MTGLELKQMRKAASLKAREIADETGWDPSQVSRLEHRLDVLPADVAKYIAAIATLATKRTEEAA